MQIKGGGSGDRILDVGQHRVGAQGKGSGIRVTCRGATAFGTANAVFLPWQGSGTQKRFGMLQRCANMLCFRLSSVSITAPFLPEPAELIGKGREPQ